MEKVELKDIYKIANILYALCEKYEKQNIEKGEKWELGDKALELIGDYPLYGSTSNITYAEALATASVLFGDIEKTLENNEKIRKELENERNH